MKNLIKITSYVILAGFFSIALSGCGKKKVVDPNANKVVVWSFEDEDAWRDIKKNFESSNKGYTLIYKKEVLDEGYENRVLNSMISGQGPDLWAMPNDWIQRHVDKLAPMPKEIAKGFNMDQFIPVVKDNVIINNNVYALAPSAEPLMVYYNPRLFSNFQEELKDANKDNKEFRKKVDDLIGGEPPSLWSDFVEAAKLLTKKNGETIEISGLAAGTSNITHGTDLLYLLMLQNNTNIISYGEKVATFNLPQDIATGNNDVPGKRAIEFYTSFADPASPNYTWNDSIGNDIESFANGKVAMMFGFSNMQNTFLQKYPSVKYKKAYAPQLNGDAGKMTDFARFNAFGVSKLARNINAAWVLNTKISSEYRSGLNSFSRLYTSEKSNSVNDNYTMKERTGSNPEKLSLIISKTIPKGRYPLEFDRNLRDAISLINAKKQDSQSALDLAASKSTDLLRQEGW